ncbi:MAG: protein phosphatase 2C domain-containing protein [Taibaiella sp.]|nr:protein phosphatase 2C domain-containing protein [Taibaiella sp.]
MNGALNNSELKNIHGSIKGTQREINKDSILIIEDTGYNIYAIFDGVSSASGAKDATIFAKKFIRSNHRRFLNNSRDLSSLMNEVNQKLISLKIEEPYTTYCIVVYFFESKNWLYSSIGDSRIYLISNQYLVPITRDDNIFGNTLTKYLGNSTLTKYDFYQISLEQDHNSILLCTDGFYSQMEKEKLKFFEMFNYKSLIRAKQKIYNYLRHQNRDDASFILIR